MTTKTAVVQDDLARVDVAQLAKRIERDRLDRRMTWPAYAAWMGLPQSTIYKIAMGRTPRPHQLTVETILAKLKEPKPGQ